MAVEFNKSQIIENMPNTLDIHSQEKVLAWAGYGNSIEKIEFLKAFLMTMGIEEIRIFRNLIGHRLQKGATRKRQWVGPELERRQPKEAKGSTAESLPMKPMESLPAVEPWWREWQLEDVVAVDVEKVSLNALKGVSKGRAAKIAVVDRNGKTIFRSDVYHEPGTFDTSPKAVQVSGIRKNDLVNAPKWKDIVDEEGEVVQQGVHSLLKQVLKDKLVITCDGTNDFLSMDIDEDDYSGTFDLQSFYRRPQPNCSHASQPMSLRDMYFFHFEEDFQFEKPHDCEKDARSTMKVFCSYRTLKMRGLKDVIGDPSVRTNVKGFDFSCAPNLKSYESKGYYYCKTNKSFIKKCNCQYCRIYQ